VADAAGVSRSKPIRRLALAFSAVGLVLALLAVWSLAYWNWTRGVMGGTPAAQDTAAKQAQAVVAERIPFISDRDRADVGIFYVSAPDHKALAISYSRMGMIAGQADTETAKTEALERCRKALEAAKIKNDCYLYAVGNTVVYARGYPPMPPQPWVRSDPGIERPFNSKDVPLISARTRSWIDNNYPNARKSKALALSPRDDKVFRSSGRASRDEAARVVLEGCGSFAGVACMIIAIDDTFVVPIPSTVKVIGFFQAAENQRILPRMRDDVARRLAEARTGWSAVAVGASGMPRVASGAASEQSAVEDALAACNQQDKGCELIAVGPFSVAPEAAASSPVIASGKIALDREPPAPIRSAGNNELQRPPARTELGPLASNTSTVGNYEIGKLSSISGPLLVTDYIAGFDASRPDSGVETCARRCDATQGCKAFDVSLVYSKCSLYGAADRTVLMGGYISGIKR